jgi:predicted double-glycine peptidase
MAVSPDKDLVLVSEPGSSEASGSVSNGQILQILETQGDWVKICYAPGKTGWIKKDLLAAQSDAGTIGVPPAAPPSILDPAVTDNRPSSGTNTSVPDPNDTVADNTVADNTVAGTDTSKTDNQAKDNTDTGKKDTKDPIIEPDSNFEKYSSKEVIVKVPQRTQYDPANGEYQNSWCGPTSLAMIFEFYGIKKTTSQVAENTYNFAQRNGTPSNKLAREAQLAGFEASRVETGKDLDFLEKTCREGKPVIVNVDVAWKSGHYMVVVGMTDDKVIVNDPGRREVRRELDKEWFMTQWEGRSKRVIIIE